MKTLTKKDEHVGKTVVFLPPSKHYSKEVAEKLWTKEYLDKIAETKADSYEYEWPCYDNLDSEDTNLTSKNIPVGTLVDIALHDDLTCYTELLFNHLENLPKELTTGELFFSFFINDDDFLRCYHIIETEEDIDVAAKAGEEYRKGKEAAAAK